MKRALFPALIAGLTCSATMVSTAAHAQTSASQQVTFEFVATSIGDGLAETDPAHRPDIEAADGIGTTPVEDRPMAVQFTVWNNTHHTISGYVDGLVSEVGQVPYPTQGWEVRDLPPGATLRGVLRFTAPPANDAALGHHQIQLRFHEEMPLTAEFPTYYTWDWDLVTFDSAARYWFDVSKIRINTTRSLFRDTDYVTVSRVLPSGETASYTRSIGKLNNGLYGVGLWTGTFDAVPNLTGPTSVGYLVTNTGYNGAALDVMNWLNAAGKIVASVAYPEGNAAWPEAKSQTDLLNAALLANCDGPVAAFHTLLDSGDIALQTGANNYWFERTDNFVGSPSPGGCGSLSNYDVTRVVYRHRIQEGIDTDAFTVSPFAATVRPGGHASFQMEWPDPTSGNPWGAWNNLPAWGLPPAGSAGAWAVVGGARNGSIDVNGVYTPPANIAAADHGPDKLIIIEGRAAALVCLEDDANTCRTETRVTRAYVQLMP